MGTAVLGGSRLDGSNTLGGPGVDSSGVQRVADAMLSRAGESTAEFLAKSAALHTAAVGTLRELTVGQLGTDGLTTRAIQYHQLPDLIAACKGQIQNETISARAMEQITAIAERGNPTAELKSALELQNEANARIASKIEADLTPILHPNSLRKNSEAILDAAIQEYAKSFPEKPQGVERHLQLLSRELRNSVDEATGLVDPIAIRTLAIHAQSMPTMRLKGSGVDLFNAPHKAVLAEFFEKVNAAALQLGENVQTARHLMNALSIELPPRELSLPTPEQRVGSAPLVVSAPDPFAEGLEELAEMRRQPIARPIKTTLGTAKKIAECGVAQVSLAPVMAGELRVGTAVSFYFPRVGATFTAQDFSPWYSDLAASGTEAEKSLRSGIEQLAKSSQSMSADDLSRSVQEFLEANRLTAVATNFTVRSPVAGFEMELNSGKPQFGYVNELPSILANALKDTYSIRVTPNPDTQTTGTNGQLKSLELQCTGDQAYTMVARFGVGTSSEGIVRSTISNTVRNGQDVSDILRGMVVPSKEESGNPPVDRITAKLLRQGTVTELRNFSSLDSWQKFDIALGPSAVLENCNIACSVLTMRGSGLRASNLTIECSTGTLELDRVVISSSVIKATGTLEGTVSGSRIHRTTLSGEVRSALSFPGTTYTDAKPTGNAITRAIRGSGLVAT